MCGPASLSIALGRLGVYRSPPDIASQCKVTTRGITMTDLERDANRAPLISARVRRSSWAELRRLDGVAVLHVMENHFVAVDPRKAPDGQVRIYEPEKPMQWWPRAKLEEIWRGEAIEITRMPAAADANAGGACIDWVECYIDQGILAKDVDVAHYEFAFRNVGGKDLEIGDIHRSCGCMDHKLSQTRLAPGESAVISLSVDLRNTQGFMGHYAVVNTNDAACPKSVLKMSGGVPRARVLSSDIIHLEELPRGGKVAQQFYVADSLFNGFTIREVRFVPHGNSNINQHLTCVSTHERLGADAKDVSGFAVTARDYVVRLSFNATSQCPVGPFQGDVMVVLEADGVMTTHQVAVEGSIVHDVHSVPRLALIAVDAKGAGSATIQLRSRAKNEIRVAKMWLDNPDWLQVRRDGENGHGDSKYVITAQQSVIEAGAAPLQRNAYFELNDGSIVSVPVALFKPPHQ